SHFALSPHPAIGRRTDHRWIEPRFLRSLLPDSADPSVRWHRGIRVHEEHRGLILLSQQHGSWPHRLPGYEPAEELPRSQRFQFARWKLVLDSYLRNFGASQHYFPTDDQHQ